MTGCSARADAYQPAIQAFLARHGHICLGMRDWPIDVTPAEFSGHARNAIQMPVLQQLGLVSAGKAVVTIEGNEERPSETVTVERYRLTEDGRKFYRSDIGYRGRDGKQRVAGDLCAATVTLDAIKNATPPAKVGEHVESTVTYTYKIDAAPWMADERARKAFPVVANLVDGAGKSLLTTTVIETAGTWAAPDDPR